MAHNYRVKPVPHKNKDGTESKTKKDYIVLDRTRRGTIQVGVASSQKAASDLIAEDREKNYRKHLEKHPHDSAFRRKHKESAA